MREIIFRGKRKDNGEWVYGDLIHYACNNGDVGIDNAFLVEDENDIETFDIIPETVGQYTGLTDKNGKKIWEGDIVEKKFDDRVCGCYVVNMNKERGGWFPFACGDGCGCCEDEVVRVECCEVIGNITDNPELLKGGN